MSSTDLTLSVSEFKAKCLGLFDRLAAGEFTSLTVTRRGKPIAQVRAAAATSAVDPADFDEDAWRRELAAIPMDFVKDYDWSKPILEQVERFEAERLAKEAAVRRESDMAA